MRAPAAPRSVNARGALYALASFAIYSTHDVVVKFLGGAYSPFQIVFFSTLFGFPIVAVMLMRDREEANLRPRRPLWTGLRTASAMVTTTCAFYAFSVLPMAQTYAIIFAAPLLITILAIPVLGETVGWRRGLAVLAGLAGVIVVLQPGDTAFTAGHLAALAAAVFSAFAAVIIRKIGGEERSAVLLLYPMMANFLVMACALPFVYRPMPALHLGGMAMIAALGFCGAMCLIAAYRRGRAVVVAPMQYSQILWAALYGAVFFHETPDRNTAIGAAIIIASGLFVVLREERPNVSRNRPVLQTMTRYVAGTYPRIGTLLRLSGTERPQDPEPTRSDGGSHTNGPGS
ncbi:DMT family transporter [Amaricoccus sp.]|uniref:DMT family transporter n=1 Tax=Amaricoccus sp. TaxID=1872485 RepID=UPI001B61437A|nr:DMT family transporter [Amaricoccus sp.]MBP7240560.1 DMT family transporter [Amaricoccus sp.]